MKNRLQTICRAIEDKQGDDLVVLKVGSVTSLSSYFVIASADNEKKLKSISDNVEDELEKVSVVCNGKEGHTTNTWIILDYGDIMVHLFKDDARAYYNLERLWKDAPRIDVENLDKED